jgi:hypothetical protein
VAGLSCVHQARGVRHQARGVRIACRSHCTRVVRVRKHRARGPARGETCSPPLPTPPAELPTCSSCCCSKLEACWSPANCPPNPPPRPLDVEMPCPHTRARQRRPPRSRLSLSSQAPRAACAQCRRRSPTQTCTACEGGAPMKSTSGHTWSKLAGRPPAVLRADAPPNEDADEFIPACDARDTTPDVRRNRRQAGSAHEHDRAALLCPGDSP